MTRIRGEEQPGFVEVLSNWLPHQRWFPAPRGRRNLTRVGGLRLPTPAGDTDAGLFLELHIFEVGQPDPADDQEPLRISVPLTLRSRPSALAGKSAFIGKLTSAEGQELWVYDGAYDRAFLTAWVEMARRRQGSRNGRSRGEALAGFSDWEPFTVQMRRDMLDAAGADASRVLITPEGVEEDWEKKVIVDLLRRPAEHRADPLETVITLTAAHSTVVPRVLGTVSGAWEDQQLSTPELIEWQYGLLGVVREASAEAPSADILAASALKTGESFKTSARQLGRTLGTFHADLAGAFGAYPQSGPQLSAMAADAQQALTEQWTRIREDFDEDEAADLSEVIDLMTLQLREADEPLTLQTIHGGLGLQHFHRYSPDRWVISEEDGMVEHAPGLQDAAAVLMSLAATVMQVASQAPAAESRTSQAGSDSAETSAEAPPSPGDAGSAEPINFGRWFEEMQSQFLQGYRESDTDSAGVDSVFFRAAMLTEALQLFSQWEGKWVFRPSMLLQVDS